MVMTDAIHGRGLLLQRVLVKSEPLDFSLLIFVGFYGLVTSCNFQSSRSSTLTLTADAVSLSQKGEVRSDHSN